MSKADHQKSVYFKDAKVWKAIGRVAEKENRSINFILERIATNDPDVRKYLNMKLT